MKNYILPILLATLLFAGGYYFGRSKPINVLPPKITLEQILSIRELHLVRHTYSDLFFLHKQNNPHKAIRAIVHVPVEISAFINLKDIEVVKQGDSVKQLILPKARLQTPHYHLEQMVLRETRSFQLHAGKDLYPEVGKYLQASMAMRMDTLKTMAVTQRILLQAEEEALMYVKALVKSVGREDILVCLKGEEGLHTVVTPTVKHIETVKVSAGMEPIPYGFAPLY